MAFNKKIFNVCSGIAMLTAVTGCQTGGYVDPTGPSTLLGAAAGGYAARELSGGDDFATAVGVIAGGAIGNMVGQHFRNPCITRTDGVVTERALNGIASRDQRTQTRVGCVRSGRPADFQRPQFQQMPPPPVARYGDPYASPSPHGERRRYVYPPRRYSRYSW